MGCGNCGCGYGCATHTQNAWQICPRLAAKISNQLATKFGRIEAKAVARSTKTETETKTCQELCKNYGS